MSSWKGSMYSWDGKERDKLSPPDDSDSGKTSSKPRSKAERPCDMADVSALSMANMKQHDLEMMMEEPVPASNGKEGKRSQKKKRRRKRSRRKVLLPQVESLVSRDFPLPNPTQIDMYSRVSDSVRLIPRPRSSSISSFLDSDKSGGSG